MKWPGRAKLAGDVAHWIGPVVVAILALCATFGIASWLE